MAQTLVAVLAALAHLGAHTGAVAFLQVSRELVSSLRHLRLARRRALLGTGGLLRLISDISALLLVARGRAGLQVFSAVASTADTRTSGSASRLSFGALTILALIPTGTHTLSMLGKAEC